MSIKAVDKKYTTVIQIKNLTIAQSIALEDMMHTWETLGNVGGSRWTSFFADGDGNFHPKILYNGTRPRKTDLLDEEIFWKGNQYKIDSDAIAWKLIDNVVIETKEANRFGILRILLYTILNGIQSIVKKISYEIKRQRRLGQSSLIASTDASTKKFHEYGKNDG
jgi:hypothetical protein